MNFEEGTTREKLALAVEKMKKDMGTEVERNKIIDRSVKPRAARIVHQKRIQDEIAAIKDRYAHVAITQEKEERLAEELSNRKREDIVNIKRRQQLRNNNIELRELERKLDNAYTLKTLSAQIAEKEYNKFKEKELERNAIEDVVKAIHSPQELLKLSKQEDIYKKAAYCNALQNQMIEKYQRQQNEYENSLLEKKQLDQVIQRMHDEDTREQEYKKCNMLKFQQEIAAFKATQALWKEKERAQLEEENKKLENYLKNKEHEEREKRTHKKEMQAAKDKQAEELAKKIFIEHLKQRERREFLDEFAEIEVNNKKDQRIQHDFEKEYKLKLEIDSALAMQLEDQKQKQILEEEENARYREIVAAQKLADDTQTQLTKEKNKQRRLEYGRELRESMKEKEIKRAIDLKTITCIQEQDKIIAADQTKFETERTRMLKEHTVNLIGYLPPGILRSDDLDKLDPKCKEYYTKRR